MKRIIMFIVLVIIFVAVYLFTGSKQPTVSNETKELKLNTINKIDEYVEFRLVKINTTNELKSSYDSDTFYKTPEDNMVFVDAVFDVRCINETEIPCNGIINAFCKSDKSEYSHSICVLENDDGVYEKNALIKSDKFYRIHCAVAVDKFESEVELIYMINNISYTYEYKLNQNIGEVIQIQKGDVISNNDYAEFCLKDIIVIDEVMPENTSGEYNYYKTEQSSDTYVVVKYDIINNLDVAKGNFVGVKATTKNKEYYGFNVCENKNRNGFDGDLIVKPDKQSHMYCLIQIPESEIDDVVLEIEFDKKYYCYNFDD